MIEYLQTENRVLIEKFGKRRILLSDDQRRRLAVKGQILGRKRLEEVGTLFTPDTMMRWHRTLVAKKWDCSDRREKKPGRPRIRQVIVDLTVKFAKQNPTWGFKASSPKLAIRFAIPRLAISSKLTVLNLLLRVNELERGRRSSRRTAT